jgi:antitoxin VapB
MTHPIARIIEHDEGQAVLLPAGFRFHGGEVFVRRDPRNGDVILSARPELPWLEFIALRHLLGPLPAEALCERVQGTHHRDPFDTWAEVPARSEA